MWLATNQHVFILKGFSSEDVQQALQLRAMMANGPLLEFFGKLRFHPLV